MAYDAQIFNSVLCVGESNCLIRHVSTQQAMSNRTVLVDNNTWNNTHIATVALAFASPEEQAYYIAKDHDVSYVLVVFGGLTGYASDDINKFLWMVRIGGTVYPQIKEADYLSKAMPGMPGDIRIDGEGSKALHQSLM